MYKITIEEIGTNKIEEIECRDYIVSGIKKKVNGINFHAIAISPSNYVDLTRLYLATASYIHVGFNKANEDLIQEIVKDNE